MDMEARRGRERASPIEEEVTHQLEVTAHRSTHVQAWIALAALVLTLAGIILGAVVNCTQIQDKLAAIEHQGSDHESRLRAMEGSQSRIEGAVNQIAERVGAGRK